MGGQISKQELNKALTNNLSDSGISFLSKADEDDALDVLTDAFKEDPMLKWIAGLEEDDPEKDQKMYKLCRSMQGWVNHRIISGSRGCALGVRTTSNELVGCMTLSPSSCARERMLDVITAMFKFGVPPMYKPDEKSDYGPHSVKRCDKLNVLLKRRKEHMKGTKRWIYLQTIGVRSDQQHGKGHGKKMLQLLMQTADKLSASLYLETEAEHLESMYKHFGFHTVEKLNLCAKGDGSPTANFTMYLMKKDPD